MQKIIDDLICERECIHQDFVENVREQMPEGESIINLANVFKALGDPTRLKIVIALSKKEICSCDIAMILNMNKSAISHQLRILKQMKIVKYRKEGKNVFYSLDDDHIKEILEMGMIHINE